MGTSKNNIAKILTKYHKEKSPRTDKIPKFWLDCFSVTHDIMTTLFNGMMLGPTRSPKLFSPGVNNLLPKNNDRKS